MISRCPAARSISSSLLRLLLGQLLLPAGRHGDEGLQMFDVETVIMMELTEVFGVTVLKSDTGWSSQSASFPGFPHSSLKCLQSTDKRPPAASAVYAPVHDRFNK